MDFKSIGLQANINLLLKSKLIQCSLLRLPKIVKAKHFKSPETVESSSILDFRTDACSKTELQVSQSEYLEPYNMKQNVKKKSLCSSKKSKTIFRNT